MVRKLLKKIKKSVASKSIKRARKRTFSQKSSNVVDKIYTLSTTKQPIKAKKENVSQKHIPVKLAGALYVILGLVTIFSGFIFVYLSYFSAGPIIALGEILMQGSLAIFIIGITSITLGALEFLIGFGIWKMHKWAATLGLVLAVISIILSIPYSMLNPFAGIMSLAISIILAILLYISRKEFSGLDFQ